MYISKVGIPEFLPNLSDSTSSPHQNLKPQANVISHFLYRTHCQNSNINITYQLWD